MDKLTQILSDIERKQVETKKEIIKERQLNAGSYKEEMLHVEEQILSDLWRALSLCDHKNNNDEDKKCLN